MNNTRTFRNDYPSGNYNISTYCTITNKLISSYDYYANRGSRTIENVDKNGTVYKILKLFDVYGNLTELVESYYYRRILHKKYYDNGNLEFIKTYDDYGTVAEKINYNYDGTIVTSD